MARDAGSRQDLPEGFAAQTIARLLEQGRRDRLYMRMNDARARFREALEVLRARPRKNRQPFNEPRRRPRNQ